MAGQQPQTQTHQAPGGGASPGYGWAKGFYNSLPGVASNPYPTYQGKLDPGLSPTMQNTLRMGQAYSQAGPSEILQGAQGSLGRFMTPSFSDPRMRLPMGSPDLFGANPNQKMFGGGTLSTLGQGFNPGSMSPGAGGGTFSSTNRPRWSPPGGGKPGGMQFQTGGGLYGPGGGEMQHQTGGGLQAPGGMQSAGMPSFSGTNGGGSYAPPSGNLYGYQTGGGLQPGGGGMQSANSGGLYGPTNEMQYGTGGNLYGPPRGNPGMEMDYQTGGGLQSGIGMDYQTGGGVQSDSPQRMHAGQMPGASTAWDMGNMRNFGQVQNGKIWVGGGGGESGQWVDFDPNNWGHQQIAQKYNRFGSNWSSGAGSGGTGAHSSEMKPWLQNWLGRDPSQQEQDDLYYGLNPDMQKIKAAFAAQSAQYDPSSSSYDPTALYRSPAYVGRNKPDLSGLVSGAGRR